MVEIFLDDTNVPYLFRCLNEKNRFFFVSKIVETYHTRQILLRLQDQQNSFRSHVHGTFSNIVLHWHATDEVDYRWTLIWFHYSIKILHRKRLFCVLLVNGTVLVCYVNQNNTDYDRLFQKQYCIENRVEIQRNKHLILRQLSLLNNHYASTKFLLKRICS